MKDPIAVFDAGIGSYAIVNEIQKQRPKQDILYFADRASFPYGDKSQQELVSIMRETIKFLESYSPSAIVMASNAPSIMVLDTVRQFSSVPIFGVYPPLARALSASTTGSVGIMGVRSLIESDALRRFVQRNCSSPEDVALINASPLVGLVENGAFLFSPAETRTAVSEFLAENSKMHPQIDVFTLSSTHLPWLCSFFEDVRSDAQFLDPAVEMVAGIEESMPGTGRVCALVSEDPNYNLDTFRRMLAKIGVTIPLELVRV